MSPQPWVIVPSLSVAQTVHSQWSQDVHRWHNFTLRNTFTDYQAATEESYLHCLTFSEQISERAALLAMTGCDSVSHLLSYIAAFPSHCKLQKVVAAGSRGHASFAGSHQRQPGSAPDQHTDPVLSVRWNKIVKKKIVLNDATRLAWGLWALDNLQLMKHGWDCSELRVIKHLQGCFIPQRTTTRSTRTFHLCNLVKTAAHAHSWWSRPSLWRTRCRLADGFRCSHYPVLQSTCWRSHALKMLTLTEFCNNAITTTTTTINPIFIIIKIIIRIIISPYFGNSLWMRKCHPPFACFAEISTSWCH